MIARVAVVVAALAAAASTARAQEGSRWGSLEIGAGPYRPDIDAEFPAGTGPYEQVFGSGRRWMFRTGVGKTVWRGFGDLEVGFRTGISKASGRGLIAQGGTFVKSGDQTALWIVPTSLTVTYYFDWVAERYRWIPLTLYGRGALERYNWWVTGGGGSTTKRGATNGWSVTGGAALLLDALDPGMARELERDTGIDHTYLFFDVTKTKVDDFGSSTSWDLSSDKPAFAFGLLLVF